MKKLIIGLVAVLIIGGGATAYMVMRNDDEDGAEVSEESSTAASFAPESTENIPFEAEFANAGGGINSTAIVKYDGSGTWEYTTTNEGQTAQIILTADAYYSQTNGVWYKIPLDQQNDSQFDVDSYQYDQTEISNLQQSAVYQGVQTCASGRCHVWQTTVEGSTSTVFIDTSSNRITQVEVKSGDTTSTITYKYGEVTVTVPTDAQEFPALTPQ